MTKTTTTTISKDSALEPDRSQYRPPHHMLAQAASVAHVVFGCRRVLVQAHVDPDGDACGSSLALAQALRECGCAVTVYSQQKYPSAFSWLPGTDLVVHQLDRNANFDVTCVLDAGDIKRVGIDSPDAARMGTLCWIDHHPNADPPGDFNYVDPDAPAVGEQVREILRVLGHPISPTVAKCIYASLVSDTGSFRYSNTTPRALSLAAEMVACGVDVWEMTERIYESQPKERVLLLARVLSSLTVSTCGRYASLCITQDDLDATGADEDLTDGFINHARSIAGVEIAVQFKVRGDEVKVGFRSRGHIDVSTVAQLLGGGGHPNAAGCRVHGELDVVRRRVFSELDRLLEGP